MPNTTDNPYEAPPETGRDVVASDLPSRSSGFKLGMRNGALWSLLLVLPTVPTLYAEMTIHKRMQVAAGTGTRMVVALAAEESAIAWIYACCTALVGITLPWALTAGCVGHLRSAKSLPATYGKSESGEIQ